MDRPAVGDEVLVKDHLFSSIEKEVNTKLAPKLDGPHSIKRVPTTFEFEEEG